MKVLKSFLIITAIFFSIKDFAQSSVNPEACAGKWKLIKEVSEDSSFVRKTGKEYQLYYQFFRDGSFKRTHIRNDKQMKGTYYTLGKWKIVDGNKLLLYDRKPYPPKDVNYADFSVEIKLITKESLKLFGAFSIGGEGIPGFQYLTRVK